MASPEDLTSIFWNPAGLSALLRGEISIDFRTLPKVTYTGFAPGVNIGSTRPTFGFIGFAYPLRGGLRDDVVGKSKRGTVAFARVLGGYEQSQDLINTNVPSVTRYWFNSIGYGKSLDDRGRYRVGASIHLVELNVLGDSPSTPSGEVQAGAKGVTFGLGLLYSPKGEGGLFRVGLSYLHPTRVGDLGEIGGIFGQKISGRVNLGTRLVVASGKGAVHQLIWTTEARYFFGGDDRAGILEQRKPTVDFHTGFEYQFPEFRSTGIQPLFRLGALTRNSSDSRLFYNDRLLTTGFGLRLRDRYQIDGAMEYSLVSRSVGFVASARYYIGKSIEGDVVRGAASDQPEDPLSDIKDKKARGVIRRLQQQLKELEEKVRTSETGRTQAGGSP